jgi:glucose-6-phosphate isomerase
MTDPNQASVGGGFVVTGAQRVAGAAEAVKQALADDAPARLAAKDATLWGAAAEAEAAIRLGWTDLPETSRDLLGRLAALRAELAAEGLDHVVLAGMGGSSLAPEVIARTLGVELVVLDTTDPHQVRAALADRLDRTVVVVSSKSGGTVETDSHRRAYHQAFLDSGLSTEDAGRRFVVVTDPGSPLEATAAEFGARAVFLADPNVGGRYSALTAFGLVPSALAGVDVASLLDEAAALAGTLAGENPALALGAALGAAANAGRDKLVLAEDGSGIVGLGDWAEQLIAESTGKDGKGILPVVVESATAPGTRGPDVVVATAGGAVREVPPPTGSAPDLSVNGALGAHFLGWEYATAVAGRIIGINPFDQPNVAESKENTARILASGPPATTAAFTDGAIEVYGDAGLLGGARDVADALTALLEGVDERGYLAVLAFLDRVGDAPAAELRALLAERTTRPVTFGWGPRYLHSTGQYHKGGPAVGSFLQVTGAVVDDLPVPGRPYTFGALQAAQAAGDLEALAGRGRPTLRLHLTDRGAGVRQLLAAFR